MWRRPWIDALAINALSIWFKRSCKVPHSVPGEIRGSTNMFVGRVLAAFAFKDTFHLNNRTNKLRQSFIRNSNGHEFRWSLAVSYICHDFLTSCRAGYCAWDSAHILFRLSQMIRIETSHTDNRRYPLLPAEELATGWHSQASFSMTDFGTRMEHNLRHH
jgi:hypothetical protein